MLAANMASADIRILDWSDLYGWQADDHEAARDVFKATCGDLTDDDWPVVCSFAKKEGSARRFFESFFRPVLITDGSDPLFTGYYEPEIPGALSRSDDFAVPIHRPPRELNSGDIWLTREEIETSGVLKDRGLEIAWLADPTDKFFLQIQGSGRIRLPDGDLLRVGFAGKNGHPYRSVGNELVRRGEFQQHEVSAQVIKGWINRNPVAGQELLWHNPSYVFFREVSRVSPDLGPLGAMNRSITAGRTLAVDPDFVPLGAPVWLETEGPRAFRRLMVAQDTGSAIKGAQRADIFFGTGDEAGRIAGKTRDRGRLIVLLPIESALALAELR